MEIPDPLSDLTTGEVEFLEQYTRHLLVNWCHYALISGTGIPDFQKDDAPYIAHAVNKKWLSSKDHRVLAAGWKVAASYLKR